MPSKIILFIYIIHICRYIYYAFNAILQIFHADNIIVILEKQNTIITLMIYNMIEKIINSKSFKVENVFYVL